MTIFDIFTLMGGLALFLFGMQVMAGGLQRVAGSKLEQILERLTSTPLKGVLLGAGVTAVIQASGATTVMVVGFVNAGIMQLKQAVGIIMGANLGTTVTAWILSLTGIDGTSIVASLFKPTSFAPVLGFIGIILYLLCKNDRLKDLGTILLGFMALMYGMTFMSDAVAPLAQSPAFANLLVKFSNPFFGLLAGAVLTAVLQSSSASVGVLQAIAITGVMPFASAVPIIMGQNIGTCVTALISSIGTSTNAKRAAFIHFYFNVLGTVIFMILFYLAYYLFPFDFMVGNITAAQIALVHTTFNVIATVCLLPCSDILVKLACWTVKDKSDKPSDKNEEEQRIPEPEERFLTTPGFAVEHCRALLLDMATMVKDNVVDALKISVCYSDEKYHDILNREERIDEFEWNLSQYLLKVNQTDLSARDAEVVAGVMYISTDLEHISDHAANVAKKAWEVTEGGGAFSESGISELKIFNDAVMDIMNRAVDLSTNHDVELAKTVQPLEEIIDNLRDQMKRNHISRLQQGRCTVESGIAYLDMVNNIERMSDYAASIAAYVIQLSDEFFDVHQYYNTLSDEDKENFKKMLKDFKTEYHFEKSAEKTGKQK